jgi:hypothetical protein
MGIDGRDMVSPFPHPYGYPLLILQHTDLLDYCEESELVLYLSELESRRSGSRGIAPGNQAGIKIDI